MTELIKNIEKEIISIDKNSNPIVQKFLESNILKEQDFKDLIDSSDFMVDTFVSVPMYRSLPIKLFGVLNSPDFPTPESKIWQCKVEAEVHTNELVRDIHELELKKLKIEKYEFIIEHVIQGKLDKESDYIKKAEIGFDLKEQNVYLSLAKFEYSQLQKRIKYRIQEVKEWKEIHENIISSGVDPSNYSKMIVYSLSKKWNDQLQDPKVSEEDKKIISAKLKTLTATAKV